MLDEPEYDCYEVNFSVPPKGECKICEHYTKCKETWLIEIEEEEEYADVEEW